MKYILKYFFFILLINSCDYSEKYQWERTTELNEILKKANGKIILLDFETEW
tara:strand:- start:337 stop:492 length:156 start_codon:yes stop_codon:yes gene_type:complete